MKPRPRILIGKDWADRDPNIGFGCRVRVAPLPANEMIIFYGRGNGEQGTFRFIILENTKTWFAHVPMRRGFEPVGPLELSVENRRYRLTLGAKDCVRHQVEVIS